MRLLFIFANLTIRKTFFIVIVYLCNCNLTYTQPCLAATVNYSFPNCTTIVVNITSLPNPGGEISEYTIYIIDLQTSIPISSQTFVQNNATFLLPCDGSFKLKVAEIVLGCENPPDQIFTTPHCFNNILPGQILACEGLNVNIGNCSDLYPSKNISWKYKVALSDPSWQILLGEDNPCLNGVVSDGSFTNTPVRSKLVSINAGYYVRVLTSGFCSNPPQESNISQLAVLTVPSLPGGILGNTTVCSGSKNTYSISPVPGATSYTWALPIGWTGTTTSTSITATTGSSGGNITVTANNNCGSSAIRTLAVISNSIPATPGPITGNTNVCSGTSNTYSISPVSGATSYTWALPSGWSGNSTGTSITTTAGSTGGTITVRANGTCGNSGNSTLAVVTSQNPTTANAGADIIGASTCGLTSINLAANSPSVGTGSWSIISGTGGSFTNATSPTTNFNGTAGNSYTLRWTISNAPCTASFDDVVVTFNRAPTSSNAGADIIGASTCGLTSINLTANSPTIGTGSWSIISGTGGSFTNATSPSTNFNGPAGNSYTLRWTISNAPCTASFDDVVVTFNRAPTSSNAGADIIGASTCGLTSINLTANSPTIGTGSWSIISGTGGSFTSATSPTTNFNGTAGNSYTLRWTISNAPCTASFDDVVVTFNRAPTSSNAGADIIGASTCGLTSINLTANSPSVGTGSWSIISGTGGSFTSATSPTTNFNGTAGNSYTLRWTISNAPCTASFDDVVVTFNRAPTSSNAGADIIGASTCGLTSINLTANSPSVGTGSWSIISGTGGSFTNATSPSTNFNGTAGNSYTLRWTISNAPCTASFDDVVVTFNRAPTSSNAGADITGASTCGLTSINLAANSASVGTGSWSIISGTGGSFTNATSPSTNFNGTAGNSYTLRWTISNAPCSASFDDVVVTLNRAPTSSNAGADIIGASTCGLTSINLAANSPSVGTGSWSIISGTGGSFTSATSPTTNFNGTAGNSYTLRWTISNAPCSASFDDVVVTFNRAPTSSNAGADIIGASTCGLTSINLTANSPTIGTGSWSIISGTGGSFTSATSPTTNFNGTAGNSYTLRWTISNAPCTASFDDVVVTFNRAPTSSNAGADIIGASTCGLTSINLTANSPTIGTGSWSIISGTGGSFTNATSPSTNFNGPAGNSYTLRWTISNAPCTASFDDVVVTFNRAPTNSNAGADIIGASTCGLTSINLAANSPTIGTGSWSIISGTGGSFTNATSPTTNFNGTAGNSYTLRWTISNAPCTASFDDVVVTFNRAPTSSNAGADIIGASTCGLTSINLTANSPTIGTGSWSIISGTGGSFTSATSPTTNFNGTAGNSYTLRWTISNAPCTASFDDVVVTFNRAPTNSNAGADIIGASTCGLTSINLAANSPTIGTGSWSIISGTGGSFTNATSPTTNFNGTAGNSYTLRWTISNAPCTASFDDVVVTLNRAPTSSNAGADIIGASTCGLTSINLAANSPSVGTGSWSIISGTGGSFTSATSPTTNFNGTAGNSYTLRWTISNAPCTASFDDVVVTFNRAPTAANAGADQTGSATCGSTSINLSANTPSIGTGTWSILSGTGGTITNPSSPTSNFTGTAGSTYTLRWTISNSPCPASFDDVAVTFNLFPIADAGLDKTINCTTTSTLIGTASIANRSYSWSPSTGLSATNIAQPIASAGGTFTLAVTNTINGCVATDQVVVIADLALLTAPLSGGNQTICSNESIPVLTASAGTNVTIDWYSASSSGTLLLQGSPTYQPTGAGIYYAQARNTINGCISSARTAIILTITATPTLSLNTSTCAVDLLSYSISFASNGTVSSSAGTVNNISKTVNGIATGTNVTLTSTLNNCTSILIITAPNCACPVIAAPISGGNQTICSNESIPVLAASAGTNETIDWYSAASSGTLLLQGSPSYQPIASGIYYAQARNTINGCISSTRTAIILTITATPTLSLNTSTCAVDLLSYSISFASNGTVSSSAGTVNNISKTVNGIAAGTNVTLTSTLNSCITTLIITAPNCACPVIAAPISGGNQTICSNESIPVLAASGGTNETIDWYSASSSGTLLLQGSPTYQPTGAGIYYAQARNTINGCISSARTAIILTITATPTLSLNTYTCAVDLLSYSISFASNGTVSSSAGTVNNISKTVNGIATGTNVTLTSTLNNCTSILIITAPNCACPVIAAPISGGNQTICSNESIPVLAASAGTNETIDWYSAASSGTLLLQGSPSYQPIASGIYYAQARNTINGCISSTRTAIILTITATPTLSLNTSTCAVDLLSYSISFASNGTVSSSAGTVNNISKTVNGIAAGTNVTLTSTLNSCTSTLIITAPNCACPVIAAPISGGNQTICSNESIPVLTASAGTNETIDWYSASSSGTLLLQGSPTYQPTGAGIYYAQARNTINGCISSARTAISLTITATPTLSLNTSTCAVDLLSYSISFASNGNVSSSAGTVNNISKTVNGIATGTNVTLTSTLNNCTSILIITAPNCACPVIAAPISGGNQTICSNESIPVLTASAGTNETIDWYSASSGGTLLLQGSPTYQPTGAGTYYAQARNTINGCISSTRTAISLTINATPTLSLNTTTCAVDLLSYSISFASNGTVSSSAGTVNNISKTVNGIATGTNVTLTSTLNSCITTLIITAPNCSCPVIAAPISGGNQTICSNESIPVLTASGGTNETIDWYSAASGGTLLLQGSPTYQPTGTGIYYAQARNTINGCISSARTAISLTITATPTLSLNTTTCAVDLLSYNISFASNGTVSSSAGTVNNISKTVNGIAAGTNVTLTSTLNSCTSTLIITAPNCACPVVAAPISGGNQTICSNESIPVLTASAGTNETIDWYSASSGGTLLLQGSPTYQPTGTGIYYAQARNTINGCISSARTAIILTITATPTLSLNTSTCAVDLLSYSISFASNGTVSSSAGTVNNISKTVNGIATGTNVTLTSTLNNCTSTLIITAPNCSCPVIAAPISGGNQTICSNESIPVLTASAGTNVTIDWYSASSSGTLLLQGSPTYQPTGAGIYYAQARNTINGCISSTRTAISLTINATPTLSLNTTTCAVHLLTYSISFASNGTVSSSAGTVNNISKTVNGIAAGTNVTLTSTLNSCITTLIITAPNCACPVIAAPISGGNQTICSNESIPVLTASAGTNETIDWYSASSSGTLLLQGSPTYQPTGAGIYYAQARNTINGCISSARTAIILTITATPTLSLNTSTCAVDLLSYSISFASNGTVSSSAGTVNNISKTVNGIATGTNVTLTSTLNNCTSILIITAPNCACPVIAAPISGGNQTICSNESIPVLTASAGTNETIDWYSASSGGTLLLQGSPTYQPTGAGTYYAQARNTINGCISSTRTAISLTINATPTLSLNTTTCAVHLLTYSISFASNGTVSSSAGTVNNISKTVNGIATGTNVTLTSTLNSCITTLIITAPNCSCPVIAAPISGGNQTICSNESIPVLTASGGTNETIDWYSAASGGTLLLQGSPTYQPTGTGIYYAQARNTINGCISSARTAISLTITATPTLSLNTTTCAVDLLSYNISFASNGTVSSSAGTVNNISKTVNGIAAGTNVTLTSTLNSCTSTLIITAPNCACPVVAAPISGGNQTICSNESIPVLTASAGTNETIDWYSASSGGTLLLQGSPTYQPTGTGIYYAQARNTINGCISSARTAIILTITATPTLSLNTSTCAVDLLSYSISFASNGTVSSSAGTVNNISKTVNGIATGTNVTLTSTLNNCTSTLIITAPNCSCPVIAAPISGGNQTICSNESIPVLTASAGTNVTIDWYSASSSGTLLLQGSPTYQPTGAGIYYAQARNTINGCISSTRTAISLTINATPTLSLNTTTCAVHLLTYSISFASNGTVSSSAGTVNNISKTVNGIAAGTNVTLTSTLNSCITTLIITAPNCACPVIAAPISGGNQTICSNESIPVLTASAGTNETIDWYSASSSGTLLLQGSPSYQPIAAGTYYAQARNTINGCISSTRTAISLTINATPTLSLNTTTCAVHLLTYSISFASNGTVSSSAGTVNNISKTVNGIAAGTNVTLTSTLNNCITTLIITAPNCACPVIAAPISGGNKTICSNESIPVLTASAGTNETIDWYSAASGGTLLLQGSPSYQPTGAGIYYAQARNTINGCISSARTAIILTITATPTLSLNTYTCAVDLLSYSISFASNGTVSSSAGTVNNISKTVNGIATGTNVTLTSTLNSCITTLIITAPNCSCPVIAAPISGGNQTICSNESIPVLTASAGTNETVDWYSAVSGGTLLLQGSPTYQPTGAGTYYAQARNTINGCISSTRTAISLTINATPTLSLNTTTCAVHLLTYSISFASNGTVSSSAGTVNNISKTVNGIAAGTNVTLTSTLNSCTSTLIITAPNCACPVVAAPISGGNQTICSNESIPVLNASGGTNETIDWYSASSSGTLLLQGSPTYQPTGAGIYYAQARNTINGCISSARTAISLTITATPTLSLNTTTCAVDLLSYNISFASNGNVSSSAGTVNNISKTVNGIAAGTNVTLTSTLNSCITTLIITAPNCACPVIAAPISGGNQTICSNESIPVLTASAGTNETVDWYSAVSGGTLLLQGSPTYQPTGAGTYYAQARNTINGCISSTRTAISLTINATPTLSLNTTTCAVHLLTYSISFASNGTVSSSAGTVNNISKTVNGIATGTNVTLTSTLNSCITTLIITAPNCSCPVIAAPISGGNQTICSNESIPVLTASGGTNETIDWYSAASGGTLLLQGSPTYQPTGTGIYYAQARNTINGCISSTRTAISLTIQNNLFNPVIEIVCDSTLQFWSIRFREGIVISSTIGNVDNNVLFQSINDKVVTVKVTNGNCDTVLSINAPACFCNLEAKIKKSDISICSETLSGSVEFVLKPILQNNPTMEFSIDNGLHWSDSGIFKNLDKGTYIPILRNPICAIKLDTIFIVKLDSLRLLAMIDSPSCSDVTGGQITITTKGGDGVYSYQWNTGSDSSAIYMIDSGFYSVTVRDGLNCEVKGSYYLPELGNIQFKLDSLDTIVLCQDALMPIALPDSLSYIWTGPNNFSSDSSRVILKDSGLYHVFIFNKEECMKHDSIRIIHNKEYFNARFLLPSQGVLNTPLIVSEISWPVPDSIKWVYNTSDAEITSINLNQYTFRFYKVGLHQIRMIAYKYGCTSIIEKSIEIVVDSSSLVSQNPNTINKNISSAKLFPNPNNGNFSLQLKLENPLDVVIRVYDITGNIRASRLLQNKTEYLEKFELNNLQNGVYSLLIQSGTELQTIHFIVQH